MEGRVSPSTSDSDKPDDPPVWPPQWRRASVGEDPPLVVPTPSFKSRPLQLTLPPPPGRAQDMETYVVQFPRDQIYRVPPPENAEYVERYRHPVKEDGKASRKRFFWIFIALAAIGIAIGLTIGIFHLVFDPATPTFSIVKVLVKTTQNRKSNPAYEILLKAKNPNSNVGVDYKNADGASLYYKDKKLAQGQFPRMFQGVKNSTTFNLALHGTNAGLPSSHPVSLVLKIHVQSNIWAVSALKLWNKALAVTCDLKVSELGAKTHLLTQNCDSEFKS